MEEYRRKLIEYTCENVPLELQFLIGILRDFHDFPNRGFRFHTKQMAIFIDIGKFSLHLT